MRVAHWRYSERQRTGLLCSPLPPLCPVDLVCFFNLFYCTGISALPFAFVALWKHTEEMNPNVAHPKTLACIRCPRSSCFGRLEVP